MRAKLGTPERNLIWVGHAFFIGFLFLTVLLYRERVMVADCAYQFFHLIRTGSFAIYHNRFSPFLSQLLPLAAIHAKLPLNPVLMLYSVSVPLMMYLFYNLAAHVLKDYRAAVAIALAACMVLAQGFYFAPFELNQAVSLLIVLFALLQFQTGFKIWHWLLLLTGIILALFFHPLIIIGFLYLMAYGFLKQEKQKNWLFIFLGIFGVAVVIGKTLFLTDPYDQDKMSPAEVFKLIPHIFSLEITGNFARWLVQDYYLVIIFSALISWQYFRTRNWLLLGFYWAALLGYLALVFLAYPNGNDSLRYYLESHYQLIALIVAVPLAYDVLPPWREIKLLPVALALILGIRLFSIYQNREIFSERLTWYDKLYNYTDQFPETRFILQEQNLTYLTRRNKLTWASAHETLLYFASQQKKPLKSFLISDDPGQFGYLKDDPNKFVTAFDLYSMDDLPQHYFALPPSFNRVLTSNTDERSSPERLTITPKQKQLVVQKGQGLIPMPIQLSSQELFPSGLYGAMPTVLSYRLYKNGIEVAAHTVKTPLEVDVKGSYEQYLLVETPTQAGVYQIIPVLLPFDLVSWEPENQMELVVE